MGGCLRIWGVRIYPVGVLGGEEVLWLSPLERSKQIKISAKSPKIRKNAKKVDFLRGRFFDDFLDGQKIEKRRHDHHRVISSPGPGLHWGTIGGTIN